MLNVEGHVKDVRIDGNHKCRKIPKNRDLCNYFFLQMNAAERMGDMI